MARNLTLPNDEGIAPPLDPSPLSADEAIRIVSDLREQRQQRAENAKKARAVQVAMMYRVASLVFGDDPAWLALVSTFQAQLPDVPINPRKRINTLCKFVNGPDDTGAVKLAWSQAHRRAYVLLELAARQIPVGQAYDYLMKVANLQMLADSWKRRRAGKLAATVPGSAEGTMHSGRAVVVTIDPAIAPVLEANTSERRSFVAIQQPDPDGNINVVVTGVRGEDANLSTLQPVDVPEGWLTVTMLVRPEDLLSLKRDHGEADVEVEYDKDKHQRHVWRLVSIMPREPMANPGRRGLSPEKMARLKQVAAIWRRRVALRQQQAKAAGNSAARAASAPLKVTPPTGQTDRSVAARPTFGKKPAVAPSRGPTGRGTLGPQPPG